MRFTVAKLRAYADRLVAERRRDLNLLAAYLTGSLVEGDPFLGGTADVDVVLIYNGPPPQEHECLILHDTVCVDLQAHDRKGYEPPRRLRTDPLWGTTLFHAQPLYDPQHFLDFVQSAVRSRFKDPEIAFQRAQTALQKAREAWERLSAPLTPAVAQAYLDTVFCSLHVPATLIARWLPPRRLAPRFGQVAQRLGHPEWVAELYRLLGAPQLAPDGLAALLAQAEQALQTLTGTEAVRGRYYLAAAQAYAQGEVPNQALFPLLWWLTQRASAAEAAGEDKAWRTAWSQLGLDDVARLRDQSDAWLDVLEEFLEAWGHAQGVL